MAKENWVLRHIASKSVLSSGTKKEVQALRADMVPQYYMKYEIVKTGA